MNRHCLFIPAAAFAAHSPFAFALDENVPELPGVVVTATRAETPLNQLGSTVTVLTAADLRKRQIISAADALRTVPGLDVLASGGPGHTTSVFLRGANSSQTLVLIDGVEMNDPSSPNNGFDFANLMADNIERIEILRGGESSLYGSNPLGGVINIITKKGQGEPKFSFEGQGGSWDTFKAQGGVSGGTDTVDYNLTASRYETGGFSVADSAWGNPEADKYRNTTVDSRLGAHPLENLDLGFTARYNEGRNGLDYDYPRPNDSLTYNGTTHQLYTRGFGALRLFDNLWEQTLGFAYSRIDRLTEDRAPGYSFLNSQYLGEKFKVDWQNNLHLHENYTMTLGAEDEEDRMSSPTDTIGDQSYNTQGYYWLNQFNPWKRLYGTAAVRFDQNSWVGGKVTWRVTQALLLNDAGTTRLKGSYGTGFKAPSLVELFDPMAGNRDLKSETSSNWDLGLETSLLDQRLTLASTYFNNRFDNLIQYTFATAKVENIAQATAEGVENTIEWRPLDTLSLRGNYTYTHTENLATQQALIRRPQNKGVFEANYTFREKTELNLVILMVGDKTDVNNTQVQGYVVANMRAAYRLNEHVRLFARVDNLLDKSYQELYGYGTSRAAGFAGVTLTY